MKAITMRIEKFSRPGVILMATVVVIITSMVAANATQSITTPNAASISYNLAAGASSTAITPAINKPVLIMGCCTSANDGGAGQVSLAHTSSFDMSWAGLESPTSFSGGSTITSGISGTAGGHIVYIDAGHHVGIQVGASTGTIVIHNSYTATLTGNVTLVW
jgi:hypothetical protein